MVTLSKVPFALGAMPGQCAPALQSRRRWRKLEVGSKWNEAADDL